jgi:hemerythrin superfamily protein
MFMSLGKTDTHAVVLLKQDHHKVEKLFAEFEDADDSATKVRLAREICTELTVHATLEELLFYPAALRALGRDDDDLVREAAVEHRTMKQLIEAIDGTGPGDRLFTANVTVLMEYVKHHVREEEHELFPKVERSKKIDLEALGTRMLDERARLLKQVQRGRAPASRTRVSVPSLGTPASSDRAVEPRSRSRTTARAAGTRAGKGGKSARGTGSTRAAGGRSGRARSRAR